MKQQAETWFTKLRDQICAALEKIEDELAGTNKGLPPGRFERKKWATGRGRRRRDVRDARTGF